MNRDVDTPTVTLSAALSASGFVGTWEHDLESGSVVLDAGAAAILLGDQDFGGRPISLSQTLGGLHPDDRGWVKPEIEEFARTGGSFAAEYRVVSPSGKARRLLDLGQGVQQPDGVKNGYGVLIDITDRPIRRTSSTTADTVLSEHNIYDALATLENLALGTASFRTRVLLQMLRLEIKRSDKP